MYNQAPDAEVEVQIQQAATLLLYACSSAAWQQAEETLNQIKSVCQPGAASVEATQPESLGMSAVTMAALAAPAAPSTAAPATEASHAQALTDCEHESLLALAVNISDPSGYTPLFWTARYGHAGLVAQLLLLGADPRRCVAESENSPMHMAALHGHLDVIKVLLDANVPPDIRNSAGDTPLMHACKAGQLGAVVRLIKAGADVSACNLDGLTPLMVAGSGGLALIVSALVRAATANATTKHVSIAVDENHHDDNHQASSSVLQGVLDATDVRGHNTALHYAARAGSVDAVRILLTAGASPCLRNKAGRTPLVEAKLAHKTDCEELLNSIMPTHMLSDIIDMPAQSRSQGNSTKSLFIGMTAPTQDRAIDEDAGHADVMQSVGTGTALEDASNQEQQDGRLVGCHVSQEAASCNAPLVVVNSSTSQDDVQQVSLHLLTGGHHAEQDIGAELTLDDPLDMQEVQQQQPWTTVSKRTGGQKKGQAGIQQQHHEYHHLHKQQQDKQIQKPQDHKQQDQQNPHSPEHQQQRPKQPADVRASAPSWRSAVAATPHTSSRQAHALPATNAMPQTATATAVTVDLHSPRHGMAQEQQSEIRGEGSRSGRMRNEMSTSSDCVQGVDSEGVQVAGRSVQDSTPGLTPVPKSQSPSPIQSQADPAPVVRSPSPSLVVRSPSPALGDLSGAATAGGICRDDEWMTAARVWLQESHPEAVVLDLGPQHILGSDVDTLSFSQLEALERIHHALIAKLSDMRLKLVREQEREKVMEATRLQLEIQARRAK